MEKNAKRTDLGLVLRGLAGAPSEKIDDVVLTAVSSGSACFEARKFFSETGDARRLVIDKGMHGNPP